MSYKLLLAAGAVETGLAARDAVTRALQFPLDFLRACLARA